MFEYGGREFKNAGDAVFGTLALPRALQVSSDVFFYQLGAAANARGAIIQEWARKLSFGHPTGIDLPGEYGGLVPDAQVAQLRCPTSTVQCTKKAKVPAGTTEALYASGGSSAARARRQRQPRRRPGRPPGDAAPARDRLRGHRQRRQGRHARTSASRSRTARAASWRRSASPPSAASTSSRRRCEAIRTGLRAAAGEEGGTSADVFAGFPYTVYGKTGTAERAPNPDQSWYAAYVADPVKPIVVAVTIEKGGFGAEAAAPAARLILSKWFGIRDAEFRAGTSATPMTEREYRIRLPGVGSALAATSPFRYDSPTA